MKSPIKLSFGEEVANAITHLVPAIAVLVCMPIVSIIAYTYGTIMDVVAVTIFCISLFFSNVVASVRKHKIRIFMAERKVCPLYSPRIVYY